MKNRTATARSKRSPAEQEVVIIVIAVIVFVVVAGIVVIVIVFIASSLCEFTVYWAWEVCLGGVIRKTMIFICWRLSSAFSSCNFRQTVCAELGSLDFGARGSNFEAPGCVSDTLFAQFWRPESIRVRKRNPTAKNQFCDIL